MNCPDCDNRLVPHGRGKNTTLLCNKCGKKHALGSLSKAFFSGWDLIGKTAITRIKEPTLDAKSGRHVCTECNDEGKSPACKKCKTQKSLSGTQRTTKPSQRNNKNYTILRAIDKDDPCWDGYMQVGMKKKNGKKSA